MIHDLEIYQKTCPVCHEKFQAKRTDAVFCSTPCKAFHNNHKKREETLQKRQISKIADPTNAILWKNREILNHLVGKKADLEMLRKTGFMLGYVTKFDKNTKGQNVFYCYDLAYTFEDQSTIEIYRL